MHQPTMAVGIGIDNVNAMRGLAGGVDEIRIVDQSHFGQIFAVGPTDDDLLDVMIYIHRNASIVSCNPWSQLTGNKATMLGAYIFVAEHLATAQPLAFGLIKEYAETKFNIHVLVIPAPREAAA